MYCLAIVTGISHGDFEIQRLEFVPPVPDTFVRSRNLRVKLRLKIREFK